jgi:hypothetical protein
MMRPTLRFGVAAFALFAAQAGCSGNNQMISGCQSDNQCTEGQTCRASDGKCVPKPDYTTVTVERVGDGSGLVSSNPAGIDCGNTCSGSFQVGAALSFTATPAAGSQVGSFSVGCASGTSTCTFTPDSTDPVRVVVNFSLTGSGGPAPLCNSSNFCWENPKPTGNRLNDVAVPATADAWAVGDAGTILHRSGATFTLVSIAETRNFYAAWGSGNDLYVVGEGGTIYHGVNGVFTPESSGVTTDLYDVWGSGSTVFAVGAGGRILRRSGSSWSPDTSNTTIDLHAIYGNSTNDIWALGNSGTAVHYTGTSWSVSNPAAFGAFTLRGVAGGGSGPIYAIDSFGDIYSYNGAWSSVRSVNTDDLYGLAVIASTPYVVGNSNGGLIMHYTGSAWQSDLSGGPGFRGVGGSSSSDLWAVGEAGNVWQSDGSPWVQRSSGAIVQLSSIWAADGQSAWAVGNNGTVMSYNGSYFTTVGVGASTTNLNGVWASSPSDVFIVGNGGTILHYNGTSWITTSSGTTQNLRAVFGVSASRVFAVGDGGTALAWNGSSWSPLGSSGSTAFQAVWASGVNDIWAVGGSGKVQHSTGGSFSDVTGPGTTATLGGIFGSSPTDFWVTADNMLYHYTGGSWSGVTPSPAVSSLRGIWGSGASDLYAVGQGGALLHYTGVSWSRVVTGAGSDFFAVMASAQKLWIAGSGGTILRKGL